MSIEFANPILTSILKPKKITEIDVEKSAIDDEISINIQNIPNSFFTTDKTVVKTAPWFLKSFLSICDRQKVGETFVHIIEEFAYISYEKTSRKTEKLMFIKCDPSEMYADISVTRNKTKIMKFKNNLKKILEESGE